MKPCLICHAQAEDTAASCACCGEGSFGAADGSSEPSATAEDDAAGKPAKPGKKPKAGKAKKDSTPPPADGSSEPSATAEDDA